MAQQRSGGVRNGTPSELKPYFCQGRMVDVYGGVSSQGSEIQAGDSSIDAPRDSAVMESVGNRSKPIPGRQKLAAGAVAAAPLRSVDHFRQHLLNQLSDAAKLRVQHHGSIDGSSGNPLRILWEKSDLPAGKFADEAARFWNLRRSNLQDLMNATSAVEYFSARFLRE